MTIAFWNINKKELSDTLVEFVNEKQVDILLLAEAEDNTVLEFLKKQNLINPKRNFKHISTGKIDVFTTLSSQSLVKQKKFSISPRWDAYSVNIPKIITFNLVCVHFHSKVNWSNDSLALECVNLATDIKKMETDTGVSETVVVGDFNMNPYESGLVAANGLHALPDLKHASSKDKGRTIDGLFYKYFYNPMWNFFGDYSLPFGTHYYREPGHVSREWNIYDQVIYRPSFANHFDLQKLEIVYKINGQNLITALSRPERKMYSDHLPIIFEIKI